MWVLYRRSSRRRVVFVSSLTLLIGTYLGLLYLSQVAILNRLPPNDKDYFGNTDRKSAVEYTLSSLDDVMSSVVDLDLQRVLVSFKSQHEQISKGTPHLRVVIASTWRSGSTFLGEIISSYPGAFYHYEPLMSYGLKQIGKDDSQSEVLELLNSLLNCNYTEKTNYLHYAYGNREMFVRNSRLWHMCSTMPRMKCYMPDNIGKLCSLFPLQVMKLVRVRLTVLAPLLEGGNTKVIWLTRDPRAVIHSRLSSVTWCTSKPCKEPKYLCGDLLQDFNTYSQLKIKFPDRVMILRYEDLAKEPYAKTKNVLEFLGLSLHTAVNNYLKEHLSSDFEAPWSTRHNPQRQAKKWMKVTPWNTIVYTQHFCRTVMKLLGYRPFDKERDLASENAVQLLNIPS